MGEAQVIHDDEFDTSGSTPKTGLYSSGSGYYNPRTGTFLQGAGTPLTTNPISVFAEVMIATASNAQSQQLMAAATSVESGGSIAGSDKAPSKSVSPESVNSGLNPPDPNDLPQPELVQAKLHLGGEGGELGFAPSLSLDPIVINPEPDPDLGKHFRNEWEDFLEWVKEHQPYQNTCDEVGERFLRFPFDSDCCALSDKEARGIMNETSSPMIVDVQMPQDGNNIAVGSDDGNQRSRGGDQLCGNNLVSGQTIVDESGGSMSGNNSSGQDPWNIVTTILTALALLFQVKSSNDYENDKIEKIQKAQEDNQRWWAESSKKMGNSVTGAFNKFGKKMKKADFEKYCSDMYKYACDIVDWIRDHTSYELSKDNPEKMGGIEKDQFYALKAYIFGLILEYDAIWGHGAARSKARHLLFKRWLLKKLLKEGWIKGSAKVEDVV